MDSCLILHYVLELNPGDNNLKIHINHIIDIFRTHEIQKQLFNLRIMIILIKTYEKEKDFTYREFIKNIYHIALTNYNNWILNRIADYDNTIEYTSLLKCRVNYRITSITGLLDDNQHKITIEHGQLIKETFSNTIFMYNGYNNTWIYKNRMYSRMKSIPSLNKTPDFFRIYQIKSYDGEWH